MSDATSCPSCGQRFKLKPELAGKRVKCPKCGQAFVVPGLAAPSMSTSLFDEEFSTAQQSPAKAVTDKPGVGKPVSRNPPSGGSTSSASIDLPRPVAAPNQVAAFTKRDKDLLRIGGGIFAAGVAALLLPLFGLQLRQLRGLGENAGVAGIALSTIGTILCISVCALRRPKVAIIAGGSLLALIVILFGGTRMLGKMLRPKPIASVNFNPVQPPGMPMGMPAHGPGGPPPFPGVVTFDTLAAQYGRDKVIRVIIRGTAGLDAGGLISKRAQAVLAGPIPSASTINPSQNQFELIMAPIDDLAKAASDLDLGQVESTDDDQRSAVIAFDRNKLPQP